MIITLLLLSAFSQSTEPPVSEKGTSDTGALLVVNIPAILADGTKPSDVEDEKYSCEAQPARFGIPDYNGSKKGRVRFLMDTDDQYGCEEYPKWTDWRESENTIVFVKRGVCKFVEKVQRAQDAKVAAVVVVDNNEENEDAVIMSPPEDFEHSLITISAVAITLNDFNQIYGYYEGLGSGTSIPTASIEWQVPLTNGQVRLELFTSSNDAEDMDFKKNFRDIAQKLGDKLIFEPVYFIENGTNYGCEGNYRCGDQCANVGRYCAVDPDHSIFFGVSGFDIVQENLRQMCVYEFTQTDSHAEGSDKQGEIWWEYVSQFAEDCLEAPAEDGSHNFHEYCSFTVMKKVDTFFGFPEKTMEHFVTDCTAKSGDVSETSDSQSKKLDDAIVARDDRDIDLLPSFAINGFEMAGSWHCPENPSVDNCNIFRALCASFLEEDLPKICRNDPGCPAGVFRDPCGECTADHALTDTSPDCDSYTNEKDASAGSVIAIAVIVALVTILLVVALYWLYQKNQEHEAVITETKKYISLDDGDLQIGGRGYGKVSNNSSGVGSLQIGPSEGSMGLSTDV